MSLPVRAVHWLKLTFAGYTVLTRLVAVQRRSLRRQVLRLGLKLRVVRPVCVALVSLLRPVWNYLLVSPPLPTLTLFPTLCV